MNKRILLIMFVIFQAGKIRAANYAPVVKIESPRSGFNLIDVEKEIKFKGKAIDLEDGELSGKSLIWTSDIDGFIGYGSSFSVKLSKGFHIIILKATDSKHSLSRDSIFITIGSLSKIAEPVADPKLEKPKPKITEIKKPQVKKSLGPSIVFLFVPSFGSLENLRGKLLNADPNDFAITTYIMVEGVWFSKPSTTKIKEDGTWICDITTVENDDLAIKIVSYLIPDGYKPPMISGEFWIFKEIEEKSLAKIEVIRKIRSGKVTILQEIDQEILAKGSVPTIGLTYIPQYGSLENLEGQVLNADFGQLAIVVYIKVDGFWWTKPYLDYPITMINELGNWKCDITTGGFDETATMIVAYLIPAGYNPPVSFGSTQIPQELEEKALAKASANRTKPVSVKVPIKAQASIKLAGICYGLSSDRMEEDVQIASKITRTVRTFGCTGALSKIPIFCEKFKVDCYLGAWLGRNKIENREEIRSIINLADQYPKSIKALIIGNEVLLRKDLTEEELVAQIKQVWYTTIDMPVTTAEIWSIWLKSIKLVDAVDFLTIHIHPYWDGIPIEKAAIYVAETWQTVRKAFPDKRVVIGETGWPSAGEIKGEAVPSEENQARFLKEFAKIAEIKGIEYFYFELFDEKWKERIEGKVGAHWGIYNSNRSLKEHIKDSVSFEL